MKNFLFVISIFALTVTACSKADLNPVTPQGTTAVTTAPTLSGAGAGGTPIPTTDVPQSVIVAIATAFPGYTITKVERDTERNVVVYEIHINNGTMKKTLYYDSNWKLLATYIGNDHHTGGDHRDSTIAIASLPQAVKDSITRFYAGYTITKAEQELKNGVITYEVQITNGTLKMTLVYDATGHLIQTQTEGNRGDNGGNDDHNGNNGNNDHDNGISLASIPASVTTYVTTNYAGYTVNDAEKKVKNGVTTYEIEIKMGNVEKTLVFDVNWVFVKVK